MKLLCALAVALAPLTATAGNDDLTPEQKLLTACAGWATDRSVIAIIQDKHGELTEALTTIGPSNPTKPLAQAVVAGLSELDGQTNYATKNTGAIFLMACANRPKEE